jgi:hypothetical protein
VDFIFLDTPVKSSALLFCEELNRVNRAGPSEFAALLINEEFNCAGKAERIIHRRECKVCREV